MEQTNSQPGPKLPSGPKQKTLLVEAADGSLVGVPEEKLPEWLEMQGQEAQSQGLDEQEGELLDKVLEMLYGEAEPDQ